MCCCYSCSRPLDSTGLLADAVVRVVVVVVVRECLVRSIIQFAFHCIFLEIGSQNTHNSHCKHRNILALAKYYFPFPFLSVSITAALSPLQNRRFKII
jgi:hypothetical protein